MVAAIRDSKPYGFDPAFEKAVVTLACSNTRFYGKVGSVIDPELLRSEPSKLAMRAAHAIYKEVGHGPAASVLVIQRLRGWMTDGKVSLEAIKEVASLFDDAEDARLPDADSVIAEVAPVLRQRIRDEAVQVAIESFGKKGDLSRAVALESKAVRIGAVDTSVGTILGPASWEEMTELQRLERLPLGVPELDHQLDGGLVRGGLGVIIGASGDGKSMMLSHIAAVTVKSADMLVAYATLELPRTEVLARVKANLTSIPINALKAGDTKDAQERLAALARLAPFLIQDFTPYATTTEDIIEWVEKCEEFMQKKVGLLIVDYGDKVGVRAKKGERESSEYTSGRVVFEGLRVFSDERKMFCWTASQANRQKDRKKMLDLNDVADSMHKIRVADLVVTMNIEGDGEEKTVKIGVPKHRTGKSRFTVGPLPTAYELGQVVCG